MVTIQEFTYINDNIICGDNFLNYTTIKDNITYFTPFNI